MSRDSHRKGLLITLGGVLAITPDALWIRLIDADAATVVFWRGLLSGLAIGCGLLAVHGRDFPTRVAAIGKTGLVIAVTFSLGTWGFVVSLSNTDAASTLFTVSTAPVFAALLARFWLGEVVPARTWAAIGICLAGIAIIATAGSRPGGHGVLGIAAALAAALSLALTFVLARRARVVSMVPAIAIAGLLVAAMAFPFAEPFAIAADAVVPLVVMGLVTVPLGTALLSLGPRHLPAPEVGLLMLGEAILGPLLVWAVVGEAPPSRVLLGGTLILVTLTIVNAIALRGARRPR